MTPVAEAMCLECGGNWFELAGEDVDPIDYPALLGAVRLNGNGDVLQVDGAYICYDCGTRVVLPQMSSIPAELTPAQLDDLKLVLPPLIIVGEDREAEVETSRRIDPSRAAPD